MNPEMQPTSRELARVPRTSKVLAVLCVVVTLSFAGIIAAVALGVVNNSATASIKKLNEFNACARTIAAQYEDRRDAFLLARDRTEAEQAQVDFRAFLTHGGGLETRDQRTARVCGTAD